MVSCISSMHLKHIQCKKSNFLFKNFFSKCAKSAGNFGNCIKKVLQQLKINRLSRKNFKEKWQKGKMLTFENTSTIFKKSILSTLDAKDIFFIKTINWCVFYTRKIYQHLSSQQSVSIPPENIRKLDVFWYFQGVKKWRIGVKWVKIAII